MPDGWTPVAEPDGWTKVQETPKVPEKSYLSRAMDIGSSALDFVKQHPAEIGATIGGIAAVPLTGGASLLPAMAAAGLGGAGGAGLGMLASAAAGGPAPATSAGVLRSMGEQGATQGLAEGGGRLVSSALKAGAGRLYQSVLKPTLAARREYPNLVATGLEHAVPVSSGGVEKAGELVGQSKEAADAMVAARAAQPNAPTIDPRQAVGGITQAVKGVKDLPVSRPQMEAIGEYGRQYLREHPRPLTLTEAQQAVRATDRYYDPAYRATLDKGNAVTAGNTAAAMGINDATRNALRASVPGLAGQNANTSALMGLKQSIEQRAGQQSNLAVVGMRHGISAALGGAAGLYGGEKHGKELGLGTFLASEALTNPAVASRLAIGAYKSAGLPYAQAIRAALLANLSGETDTGQ